MTGRRLERPQLSDSTAARLRADLASAADQWASRPRDPDALIWVGRRLAYLGRYREAIDSFTVGIKTFPTDARFLRHRGHRYLTIRRPQLAVMDLTKAATLIRGTPDAIEPDGAPNAQNIPLSTTHSNIWYHLALAHYVRGEFPEALAALDSSLAVARNADTRVADQYWRYLTLRRLNRTAEAEAVLAIARENPLLIENGGYLRVLRIFAGLEPVPAVNSTADVANSTLAYGVSMYHFLNGREKEARDIWVQLDRSPAWGAFGVLAAEAELTNR